MISARNVTFAYDAVAVLDNVNLDTRSGKVIGLIGPNGSGKTTLLRLLYASLMPTAGLVTIDDSAISTLSTADVARRAAVVAQEPPAEVPLSVADMVLLGRSVHRSMFQPYTAEDYRAAAAALRRVNARDLAERNFGSLSGGEKQRVLIARALAQQSDHLLLDEPTNHLDIRFQHEILELVQSLDVSTVVVLHDLNLAARYCHEIVLLDRGKIIATGTADAVLTAKVLEPVYGVNVQRLQYEDFVQLIFHPRG